MGLGRFGQREDRRAFGALGRSPRPRLVGVDVGPSRSVDSHPFAF